MQAPFNPKDWSMVLPASIIGISFLIGVGVWAVKQLGLSKKSEAQDRTSGELPTSYWEKHFERIEEQVQGVNSHVDASRAELITAIRDLTKSINDLTITLLRGK